MIRTELLETVLRSLHTSSRPLFAYDDVYEIDLAGPDALVDLGILQPGEHLTCVRCDQCPEECFIDVECDLDSDGDVCRAFGFCPDPGQGSRLINIDPVRLKTWLADAQALAQRVCAWLDLGSIPATVAPGYAWRLGNLGTSGYSYKVFLAIGLASPSVPASVLESLRSAIQDTLTPLLLVPGSTEKSLELLESVPSVTLTSLLCSTQHGLGLDAKALKRHLSVLRGDKESPNPPGFNFSPGYRTVWRLDNMYSLSEPQAQVIAKLHRAWADRYLYLHHKRILDNLSTTATRLQDVFKSKEDAMHELLVSNGSGGWALNIPEDN